MPITFANLPPHRMKALHISFNTQLPPTGRDNNNIIFNSNNNNSIYNNINRNSNCYKLIGDIPASVCIFIFKMQLKY